MGHMDNVSNFLNLTPLSDRRLLLLSTFLHELLSGAIDCPEMLSLICFKINHLITRNSMLFYPVYSNKNNTYSYIFDYI